jgi:YHS domain-containing protein
MEDRQQSNPVSPYEQTACGGWIPDPASYPYAEYQGRRVYFCTEACRQAFLRAPEAFMNGEIEHPLD